MPELIPLATHEIHISQPWLVEGQVAAFAKGENAADSMKKTYHLQLGEKPLVRSLKELYGLKNQPVPPEIGSLRGEPYLITHRVGVIADDHANAIEVVGYTASFSDKGSTVEVLPTTDFTQYIMAGLDFVAGIGADGHAKTPEDLANINVQGFELGANASLKVGTRADVAATLSIRLLSPVIQAVGKASASVTWQFRKNERPLVGEQVMAQTLIVPKGAKALHYTLQGFAVISRWFRSTVRIETPPVSVTVDLV